MTIKINVPAFVRGSTNNPSQSAAGGVPPRRPCGPHFHSDGMDNPRATTRAEVATNVAGARALVGDGKNFIENIVEGQYQKHLGREADAAGKAYWSAQVKGKLAAGESPEAVAKFLDESFTKSPEYQSAPTDGLVDQMYRDVLGREAEPEGKAYWENYVSQQKAQGVSTGALREDLRKQFASAQERDPMLSSLMRSLYPLREPPKYIADARNLSTALGMYQRAGGDPTQLQREFRAGVREARHADRNGDGVVSERERRHLQTDVARWLTQSRLTGF